MTVTHTRVLTVPDLLQDSYVLSGIAVGRIIFCIGVNSCFSFLEKENRVFAIDVFLEKRFFFFFFTPVWMSGGVCEGLVGP